MSDTIFSKIIKGDIEVSREYEDDLCIVIQDKYPKSRVHLLIIPKKPIESVLEMDEQDKELIGHLFWVSKVIAQKLNLSGYKLAFNVGKDGGQEIMHLHLHFLA